MKKNVSQREAIIGKALLSYRVFDLTSKFHLRLEPYFLIVLTSNLLVLVIPDEIKERRKENGRKKKKWRMIRVGSGIQFWKCCIFLLICRGPDPATVPMEMQNELENDVPS